MFASPLQIMVRSAQLPVRVPRHRSETPVALSNRLRQGRLRHDKQRHKQIERAFHRLTDAGKWRFDSSHISQGLSSNRRFYRISFVPVCMTEADPESWAEPLWQSGYDVQMHTNLVLPADPVYSSPDSVPKRIEQPITAVGLHQSSAASVLVAFPDLLLQFAWTSSHLQPTHTATPIDLDAVRMKPTCPRWQSCGLHRQDRRVTDAV